MITGLGAFSTVIAAWSRCTVLSIHPDLRRYVLTALWVSGAVGIAGIGSLALGLTGMISGGSPEWPFLLFGVVALLSSHLGLVLVPRWYRRSSTIVSSAQPTSGHILLELESDSDSTSLYATVLDTGPRSRLGLLIPTWPVQPFLGAPVDAHIYRDPASQRPVAFGTTGGLLWCMPGWQRVA